MQYRTTLIAALAVIALAGTACGGNDDNGSKPEVRTVTETVTTGTIDDVLSETPSPDSDAEPTESAPASEDPTEVIHAFGDEGGTLSDGLAVKVSKLRPYTPTEGAYTGKGDKAFVTYTVTITNGTGKVYDCSDYTSSATTGEREAEEVFDDNVGGSPSTKVLPGKAISFDQAYGVDQGSDFVLYIDASWDLDEELTWAS